MKYIQCRGRRASEFGEEYNLVTDSWEVEDIMTHYVKSESFDNYASLFVKVGDGEYLEIWGGASVVPYLWSTYYKTTIV